MLEAPGRDPSRSPAAAARRASAPPTPVAGDGKSGGRDDGSVPPAGRTCREDRPSPGAAVPAWKCPAPSGTGPRPRSQVHKAPDCGCFNLAFGHGGFRGRIEGREVGDRRCCDDEQKGRRDDDSRSLGFSSLEEMPEPFRTQPSGDTRFCFDPCGNNRNVRLRARRDAFAEVGQTCPISHALRPEGGRSVDNSLLPHGLKLRPREWPALVAILMDIVHLHRSVAFGGVVAPSVAGSFIVHQRRTAAVLYQSQDHRFGIVVGTPNNSETRAIPILPRSCPLSVL